MPNNSIETHSFRLTGCRAADRAFPVYQIQQEKSVIPDSSTEIRNDRSFWCVDCPSITGGLFPGRALGFSLGSPGLFRRDGLDQLVVVPWILGFGRCLDLVQIHVMDHAAVGAQ